MTQPKISRREALRMGARGSLALAGAFAAVRWLEACSASNLAGVAATTGSTTAAAAGCVTLTPESEEGPYYVDEGLVRSDILDGETGVPLTLTIKVIDVATCNPVAGAAVDVWMANHVGVYSDESGENTVGKKYLRGIQLTDANGEVTFKTIYPGWYSGLSAHIHTKIRTGGTLANGQYSGGTTGHTGRLFFPDDLNTALKAVYTDNGNPFTNTSADRVFTQQANRQGTLTMAGSMTAGYVGTVTVGVKA